MNNNLFIRRCETILVSMKAVDCQSVKVSDVAKWLEVEYASAGNVIAKAVKLNILKKEGAASKTTYSLSDKCYNSFIMAINEENNIGKAASKVVNFFISNVKEPVQKQIPLTPISPRTKQAITLLREVIQENEDMHAEIDLLREEIERLRDVERKYNQITELIK